MSYTLLIDSTEINRTTDHVTLVSLKKSWRGPSEFVFEQNVSFDQADYESEDSVELQIDGTTHFKGAIKEITFSGNPQQEKVSYLCLGLEEELDRIIVEEESSIRVVFNAEKDETDHDSSRYDMTVGEIIDELFTIVSFTGTNISSSPSGTGDMTQIPPRVALEGKTLGETLEILLSYNAEFDYYVNPSDGVVTFFDVTDLTAKTINLATLNEDPTGKDHIISLDIAPTTRSCFTRCIIEGLCEIEKVDDSDNGIAKGWAEGLEADWTPTLGADKTTAYYNVFRRWVLDDDNILPANLFSNQGPVVLVDNYFGYRQEYRACDVDLGDGIIMLKRPAYTESGGSYSAKGVSCHYTYRATPIQGDSEWVGTAYTSKGLKRPFLVWDNYLKKQSLRCRCRGTSYNEGEDETVVYIDESLRIGLNWVDDSDLRTGWGSTSTGFTIKDNGKLYVTVEGDASGISSGDAVELFIRDDSDKIQDFADNFIKQYKDLRYIGQIVINDIDTAFTLLHKVNIAGSDNSNLASMNAPVREIEYNFSEDQMMLTLTDSKTISIEELRRRIFPKEKSGDFYHLESGRHESLSGGGETDDSKADDQSSGGTLGKHTHNADTDEAGGDTLSPVHLIINDGEADVEYINDGNLNARWK